jgi:hypothetical protein
MPSPHVVPPALQDIDLFVTTASSVKTASRDMVRRQVGDDGRERVTAGADLKSSQVHSGYMCPQLLLEL